MHRALIDRRASHVADFFLDDPVIVLDHPDVAGFVLLNDQLVDLSRSRRDLDNAFGVDDPRLIDVAAEADTVDATQITVALSYRVRRTNTRESLVFPFYLVRGDTP